MRGQCSHLEFSSANSAPDSWREYPRSAGRPFQWVWLTPSLADLTSWRPWCRRQGDTPESISLHSFTTTAAARSAPARPHRSARLGPRTRRGGRGRLGAHAALPAPLPERPAGPTSASRFTSPRLAADLGASEGGRRSHPERSEGPNPARRPPGGVKRTPKRPRAPNVTGIRPIRAQALPPCLVRAEMGRKASRAGEKPKSKGRELRRMTIIVRSLDRALS